MSFWANHFNKPTQEWVSSDRVRVNFIITLVKIIDSDAVRDLFWRL